MSRVTQVHQSDGCNPTTRPSVGMPDGSSLSVAWMPCPDRPLTLLPAGRGVTTDEPVAGTLER